MFKTEKVSAYLNNFTGKGDDERKELKLNLYVTPITYQLANEVSPHLADRLFRRAGNDEWNPCAEMPKAVFNIGDIPAQRVLFYPHQDEAVEKFGILVETARISGIQAVRAFADKLDFRLEFDMTVQMDDVTMGICRRFFKEPIYVSMEPVQPVLFDSGQIAPGQVERCEQCQEPASYMDSAKAFFCQKHVRGGQGEVKLIAKKETPAEAEARAIREKETERQEQETIPANGDTTDESSETGYLNKRNAEKKRKKG